MFPDCAGKCVQIHAFPGMRWNLNRFHTRQFDDLKDGEVCWALNCNHVACACDGTQRDIQCLHSPARDRHVAWRETAPVSNRAPGDLPPKSFHADCELI